MKLVVGYDGSEHAKRALEKAAAMANGNEVTVVAAAERLVTGGRGGALHVDPGSLMERQRNLEDAARFLGERGTQARLVEAHGDAAEAIVEEARSSGADLVLVGTRGRNPLERLLLGSVSAKVAQRAPCDVLVAR